MQLQTEPLLDSSELAHLRVLAKILNDAHIYVGRFKTMPANVIHSVQEICYL